MGLAAILVAIVTVLVGVFVLGDVVGPPGSKVKRLAATHVTLALLGVAILLVAVVDVSSATTWISFVALIVAAGVGGATLTLNRPPLPAPAEEADHAHPADPGGGSLTTRAGAREVRKQEGHLPLPVVVVHGAAAAFTLLLVVATAATIGVTR